MNLWQRFIKYLNTDELAEKWGTRRARVIRTTIEFDNGVVRELVGDASDNWHRDIYYATHGRRIDWKQHKWTESKK